MTTTTTCEASADIHNATCLKHCVGTVTVISMFKVAYIYVSRPPRTTVSSGCGNKRRPFTAPLSAALRPEPFASCLHSASQIKQQWKNNIQRSYKVQSVPFNTLHYFTTCHKKMKCLFVLLFHRSLVPWQVSYDVPRVEMTECWSLHEMFTKFLLRHVVMSHVDVWFPLWTSHFVLVCCHFHWSADPLFLH